MASAITAQLFSKSDFNFASLSTSFPRPFSIDLIAMVICATGVPILRSTVESVKSLWSLLTGNLAERCSNRALAIPKLPSAFSKSMGLTLCGMALDPTSPFFVFCLK